MVLSAAKFSQFRTSRGRVFDYTCVSLLLQVLRATLRGSNKEVLLSIHLGGKPRERVLNCISRYVGPKQRCSQPLKQNEMDAAAPRFLVDPHQLLHALRRDSFGSCRKSCALQQRTDASGVDLRQIAQLTRQVRRHGHSGGDRLAVQPSTVSQTGFDGVAE